MKNLQKDRTTPEQSKILLELGIPIESANIVYYHTPDSLHDPYFITETRQLENLKAGKGLPCWSVGKLINIFECCTSVKYNHNSDMSLLDDIFSKIQSFINANLFDFSKLEDE